MKIALLFFGQLRFIDNPYTVESHHQAIINRFDTDIFAHTWWSEKETEYSASVHVAGDKPKVDSQALNKFRQKYKITRLQTEESKFFEEEAKEFLDKSIKHNWPDIFTPGWFLKERAFNNLLSHLYSIEQVGKLLDRHIQETGTNYDLVILSRPDVCIWEYPILEKLEKNNFYLSNHHGRFPDLQFIFHPNFRQWLNVYTHTITISTKELYSLWEPCAEALKFSSYRTRYDTRYLKPTRLPVRIVRGDDCKGPQW